MNRPLAVLAGVVAAAACAGPPPYNELRVSGHVEATDVRVAAEVGGRLVELAVVEGDRVEAGNIVARVDTREVELEIVRAQAEREAASAQLRLLEAGARPEDVRQARARIDALEAERAAVDAELAAAPGPCGNRYARQRRWWRVSNPVHAPRNWMPRAPGWP